MSAPTSPQGIWAGSRSAKVFISRSPTRRMFPSRLYVLGPDAVHGVALEEQRQALHRHEIVDRHDLDVVVAALDGRLGREHPDPAEAVDSNSYRQNPLLSSFSGLPIVTVDRCTLTAQSAARSAKPPTGPHLALSQAAHRRRRATLLREGQGFEAQVLRERLARSHELDAAAAAGGWRRSWRGRRGGRARRARRRGFRAGARASRAALREVRRGRGSEGPLLAGGGGGGAAGVGGVEVGDAVGVGLHLAEDGPRLVLEDGLVAGPSGRAGRLPRRRLWCTPPTGPAAARP